MRRTETATDATGRHVLVHDARERRVGPLPRALGPPPACPDAEVRHLLGQSSEGALLEKVRRNGLPIPGEFNRRVRWF